MSVIEDDLSLEERPTLSAAEILFNLRMWLAGHIAVTHQGVTDPKQIESYDYARGLRDAFTLTLAQADRLGAVRFT